MAKETRQIKNGLIKLLISLNCRLKKNRNISIHIIALSLGKEDINSIKKLNLFCFAIKDRNI